MVLMETPDFSEDHKCSVPESIRVHKCESNNMEKISKQDSNVDFDPGAPYSSSMDNVPLKVLFGVSNVKMRQSPTQEKKAVQMNISSPRDQFDSNELVRSKLKESLASALCMVSGEQQKKDAKSEKNLQDDSVEAEKLMNMDCQAVGLEQTEFKSETITESPTTLKRDREEFEQKHELADVPNFPGYLTQVSNQEDNEIHASPDCTDMENNGTYKRIKLEKEEANREVNEQSAQINLEKEQSDREVNEQTMQVKLEKEEVNGEVNEQTKQMSEIVHRVAGEIEAELFRKYSGINKKYKEKARSLLFNLKDRNNPELRARVVSGEITPERLCSMTAEQLASKELSQWRIAKAEELAHMIVLPDSDVKFRRLVKKTHKGEYQVYFENEDVGAEVAADGRPLQAKHDLSETEVQNMDETTVTSSINDDKRVASPGSLLSHISSDQIVEVSASEIVSTEIATTQTTGEEKNLPEIMSLDDYMGSRGDHSVEVVEDDVIQNEESTEWATEANTVHNDEPIEWKNTLPTDMNFEEGKAGFSNDLSVNQKRMLSGIENSKLNYSNGDQEWQVGNVVHSPSAEKIWEGMLQLSPLVVETVMAAFKSGEKTSAKEWAKFVEVKGRVRLDAFEKFLQELPLSRSRAVMVVTIRCKDASSSNSMTNIKEVAESYKQDERVGFAEPAPGVELYLCPPDVVILKMLNIFISHEHFENLSEEDGLIGCIVWRRNNVTSNATHKMPEKQYINAKKLALSGHLLDSPTHPGVAESVPYRTDSPKHDTRTNYDKFSVQNRSTMMLSSSKTIPYVENATAEAKDSSELDTPPGFNSCPALIAHCGPGINAPKVQVSALHDDLIDDDVPPGFGPNDTAIRNNAYSQNHAQNLDDDDLPEFEYDDVPISYQSSMGQQPPQNRLLSPQRCVLPGPVAPCTSQPPPPQESTVSSQAYFQSNEGLHSLQSHVVSPQIPQPVPRPPPTPHPSMQIRELIQKYGQSDAPYLTGPSCGPDVGGVNIATQISQQPTAIPPQHATLSSHMLMPEGKRWNAEDIPEWRPYFAPGNSSLVQPMQPMLSSQLGAPNFRGNFQAMHPPPPRVPPPQRGPQMSPPLGVSPQMPQPRPPLPQGLSHPFPPGLRPITGIIRPVPMVMSERDHGHYANNTESFNTSYNFRPALSGPDTRPLDGRHRRL